MELRGFARGDFFAKGKSFCDTGGANVGHPVMGRIAVFQACRQGCSGQSGTGGGKTLARIFQASARGNQRASSGNMVSSATRASIARKKGTILLKMLDMGTSVATELSAKTLIPTGGVI